MTVAATRLITSEELFAMGEIGRCELIQGEIVHMSPTGFQHGVITMNVARALLDFVQKQKLGVVLAAETGFCIQRGPDTVRAPDVSFVASARVVNTTKFFEGAPDLAVEVMSPSDTWSEVNARVDDWLAAGCKACWVVDPRTRSVTIYHPGNLVTRIRGKQKLEDSLVLPGFSLALDLVFAA